MSTAIARVVFAASFPVVHTVICGVAPLEHVVPGFAATLTVGSPAPEAGSVIFTLVDSTATAPLFVTDTVDFATCPGARFAAGWVAATTTGDVAATAMPA